MEAREKELLDKKIWSKDIVSIYTENNEEKSDFIHHI